MPKSALPGIAARHEQGGRRRLTPEKAQAANEPYPAGPDPALGTACKILSLWLTASKIWCLKHRDDKLNPQTLPGCLRKV